MSTYKWYDGQLVVDTLEDLKEVATKNNPPFHGAIAVVKNPGWECPIPKPDWGSFDRSEEKNATAKSSNIKIFIC